MTSEERRASIEEIRILPTLLENAVSGLNDEQLDTRYREGGWTVRQVVHHVADSHMNAYIRMKLILLEEKPTLKPYDQDSWAKSPDYQLPLDTTFSLLHGLHHRWGVLLQNVRDEEWSRTAYHPEDGDVNLEGLLRTYARHGRHHLGQIQGLKDREGWNGDAK